MDKLNSDIQNIDYDDYLSDSCLNDFLRIIKRYKTATREENDEMLREYFNGNTEMKDLIVNKNINLVISKVFGLGNVLRAEEKLDYIQSGIIGLIKAVESFDLSRGTAFSTHAEYQIQKEISYYRYNNQRLIRRPAYLEDALTRYKRLMHKYQKNGDEAPSRSELCKILKISEFTLNKIEEDYKYEAAWLDAPIDKSDADKDTLGDFISEENTSIDDLLNKIVVEEILKTLKIKLSDYEYFILYYRVLNKKTKTLEEMSEYLGITRERVRQVEETIKSNVRKMFTDDGCLRKEYLDEVKRDYNYDKIRIEPCSIENYIMYFFLRDNFKEKDQFILNEILLGKTEFDPDYVASEINEDKSYVEECFERIKKLIHGSYSNPHFYLFKDNLFKHYKNQIYNLEIDSDITEFFDYKEIIREYFKDKSLDDVLKLLDLNHVPVSDSLLSVVKKFYGIPVSYQDGVLYPQRKNIQNKEYIERDVNYSLYGYRIHDMPLSRLYPVFLENQDLFTKKQKNYLNYYVFKKSKDVDEVEVAPNRSAINKLFMILFNVEDYKNDNFTKEKYLSVRDELLEILDEREINLFDLYYGVFESRMTIREMSLYLGEDEDVTERDFRRSKNTAINTYLGTGQYYFDKKIYREVLMDENNPLGEPHLSVAKMFFLENMTYESISLKYDNDDSFTPRRVADLVKYACSVMDYYRFGITSTQKNYSEDFLESVLKNAKFDDDVKSVLEVFIKVRNTNETSLITGAHLEVVRNYVRRLYNLANKVSIEQVEITKDDVIESINEHPSINVLSEREKLILSLNYGIKNSYNEIGKKHYPIDIGPIIGISRNIGSYVRHAKEHVAAHKIGLLKTAIDFIDRSELESVLRNKRLPLSREDKNIVIDAYGLYEEEFLKISDIALKYGLREPIARTRLYKSIVTIKKYLNNEIKGDVLYKIDIKPYLKYFILEDREILKMMYKDKVPQAKIEKKFGFSSHQFNLLMQKIRMHLNDLQKGIKTGIDFDYFWSYARNTDIPYYGNQELAYDLCFLYYEKRLPQSEIVKNYYPELSDSSVSEIIREFTVAVLKYKQGITKAKEFSYEEVLEYYYKHNEEFGLESAKNYRRYFDKISRKGPFARVRPNKFITYDLIREKHSDYFRIDSASREDVRNILASVGTDIPTKTVKKLEEIFGVTDASFLTDDDWDELINVLGYLKLRLEHGNNLSNSLESKKLSLHNNQ